MFRNLHLRVGFHNLLRVFFLSFKLFSFFAMDFLSTPEAAEDKTQDFFADVVASSFDADSSLDFGLAWISVKILARVQ